MQESDGQYQRVQDYSILFADIEGFSRLKSFQQPLYIAEVLRRIAECIYVGEHSPEQANTWGDGLVAFFSAHTAAIQCALNLRDKFNVTDWEGKGLPALRIRISLHAGEVFVGFNPVTKRKELIGTEVNRAARIEPIVAPNHVYVTRDFFNRCRFDKVKFDFLGTVDLPKGWGPEEIYVASWAHESLDPDSARSSTFKLGVQDLRSILHYPDWSKFGRRMGVSVHAKAVIADYCVRTSFWNSDDVVFIESGTLPVFMVQRLYRRDPLLRPRLLITNNLGCLNVAMMAEESGGESYPTFPDDALMNCILLGGRVLDDYAATIPEDLIDGSDEAFWQSGRIGEYLSAKGVNHVIMMVSKLTLHDGPCAVSLPMRRFKKSLLRYVAENPAVRLSILGEAEKLAVRRGWTADSADIPGLENARYWEHVCRSGQANVIAAISPEMPLDQVHLAKREMIALKEAGVSCVLLDKDVRVISLGSTQDQA